MFKVEYSTRAATVKAALNDLRNRCKTSPGFLRLLRKAASEQLKGKPLMLKASNPHAQRALETAVCKLRMQNEISVPDGTAARSAYLMRVSTGRGSPWTEVTREEALDAYNSSTPDSLAVQHVIVYHPHIDTVSAAELDARTAPEEITLEEENHEWRDTREAQSAHFEDDSGYYNRSGILTKAQRREESESFEDAWKPLPLLSPEEVKRNRESETKTVRTLPAAPYYYATQAALSKDAQATLDKERQTHRNHKEQLENDADETAAYEDRDAPSLLALMEEQVKDTKGNAPERSNRSTRSTQARGCTPPQAASRPRRRTRSLTHRQRLSNHAGEEINPSPAHSHRTLRKMRAVAPPSGGDAAVAA